MNTKQVVVDLNDLPSTIGYEQNGRREVSKTDMPQIIKEIYLWIGKVTNKGIKVKLVVRPMPTWVAMHITAQTIDICESIVYQPLGKNEIQIFKRE